MSDSGMIRKGTEEIRTLEDWLLHAGPKTVNQWVDDRSAKESARAWLRGGRPAIPVELSNLFVSHPDFGEISQWEAEPEAQVSFDSFRGEPANLDVLLSAEDAHGLFVVGVEAKADEPFSVVLSDARRAAKKRLDQNPRSKGVARIDLLLDRLFECDVSGEDDLGNVRYQLCTASAAILAEAQRVNADRAVLIIHEFVTSKTQDRLHDANAADLDVFVDRLSRGQVSKIQAGELHGPLVERSWNESSETLQFYIGKARHERRGTDPSSD